MSEFIRQNRNSIIAVAVVLLGVLGYVLFFGGAEEGALSRETPATESVGRDLLATLLELKSIDLDEALFQHPAFRALSDFGVAIPPQPLGRVNPFAPLGGTVAPAR